MKEVDPSTGEAEEDGYDDEYQLEGVEVEPTDFVLPAHTGNFRQAWDALPAETEREDEYGLGQRPGLQEAVEAVIATLGMQAVEGTEAVPPNARSHGLLLSGVFVGGRRVLARLAFGIDAGGQVAMKVGRPPQFPTGFLPPTTPYYGGK